MISSSVLLTIIIGYFAILILISELTSKKADSQAFFNAKKQSSWVMVAIGMIGASLSGVSFISIPGVVGAGGTNQAFSWMQMVLGFLIGYAVIAHVLLPIYYKYNLTSIYGYLGERFGKMSHKTGAFFFLISRIIGASFRLYLVAIVFQTIFADLIPIPFWLIVLLTIILIWVYTFRGGIKTIVVTDVIQTMSMLIAIVLTIIGISSALEINLSDIPSTISGAGLDQWFFFEDGWSDPNNFYKQIVSGAFIAIVMTGLDQDMMQKNLTCRSLKDAQKNIYLFSGILVIANILILTMGAMLYIYANTKGVEIPAKTDQLYPVLAIQHLGPVVAISFTIGIIAAAYSSADSALTSLTTSFCVDFLNFETKDRSEAEKKKLRSSVHVGFSLILFIVILVFEGINNDAVINGLFTAAGYTYGPILGLFCFGIFTKRNFPNSTVLLICVLAPILTYFLNVNSEYLFGGFKFGFLIVVVNGLITFLGLALISTEVGNKMALAFQKLIIILSK